MTSPNYPSFETYINCEREIIVPAGRIIKLFITDIGIGERDQSTGE